MKELPWNVYSASCICEETIPAPAGKFCLEADKYCLACGCTIEPKLLAKFETQAHAQFFAATLEIPGTVATY